jgi:hypothetical protein
MLMDALDLVEAELEAIEERRAVLLAKSRLSGKPSAEEAVSKNPTLQGLSPYKYFAKCLRGIKAPDMEQALMVLPFHYVARIVPILLKVSTEGDRELSASSAALLPPLCRPDLTLPDLYAAYPVTPRYCGISLLHSLHRGQRLALSVCIAHTQP